MKRMTRRQVDGWFLPIRAALNAPHEGLPAALSPGVPLDAVVRGGA